MKIGTGLTIFLGGFAATSFGAPVKTININLPGIFADTTTAATATPTAAIPTPTSIGVFVDGGHTPLPRTTSSVPTPTAITSSDVIESVTSDLSTTYTIYSVIHTITTGVTPSLATAGPFTAMRSVSGGTEFIASTPPSTTPLAARTAFPPIRDGAHTPLPTLPPMTSYLTTDVMVQAAHVTTETHVVWQVVQTIGTLVECEEGMVTPQGPHTTLFGVTTTLIYDAASSVSYLPDPLYVTGYAI